MSQTKKRFDQIRKAGAKKGSEARVKKSFLEYFKKNKSNVSFGKKIELLYEWMTSGELSKKDKALVVGALLYFINPLDVIPDITPFLGFTDDLGVVYLIYNYLQNRSLEELPIEDSESSDD